MICGFWVTKERVKQCEDLVKSSPIYSFQCGTPKREGNEFHIVINADSKYNEYYKAIRGISFLWNKFSIEDGGPPLSHFGAVSEDDYKNKCKINNVEYT